MIRSMERTIIFTLAIALASCVDVSLDLKTKPKDAIKKCGDCSAGHNMYLPKCHLGLLLFQ